MQIPLAKNTLKDLSILIAALIFTTFLVWLPFFLKTHSFYNLDFSSGFNTIYRNYDGLEYVVIAKSLYNPEIIKSLPFTLPPGYYASHFPLYSLFILFFAPFLGFLKSMLFVSLLFTVLSAAAFYFLTRDFKLSGHPLFLSLLFLVLPARWLVVHSVGSAEPVFIFFAIATLYAFMKYELQNKSYYIWLATAFGILTQLSRPPGILLFLALGLYILWKVFYKREQPLSKAIAAYYPLLFIPLSLVAVFYWYLQSYGDFFAYFKSGDNIHLTFPPYQVFNKHQFWVGEMWLEDIVYIFLLGFLGGITLFKQKLYPLAFFVLTYLTATTLVAHRDIARYSLPVFPFVLIAFEKVLTSREFKIVLGLVILGIYLYAQNFIIENAAPVPNLQPLN